MGSDGDDDMVAVWREERRVSGRPGAEGAPLGRLEECLPALVLEVVFGWEDGGAMRRGCVEGVVSMADFASGR